MNGWNETRGRLVGFAENASDDEAVRFARYGRVVAFDTETTGLGEDDEVIQLSAVEYSEGCRVRTFNEYIKPARRHSDIATDVHGITRQFLRKNGREPSEVLSDFFDFLGTDVLLIAHNLRFDMRMLRQECAVCRGARWYLRGVLAYDTLSAACRIHPELSFRKGGCGYSLGTLVDSFGLDAENSHRADEDADACVKLFFRLMDDLNAVAPGLEQAAVAC